MIRKLLLAATATVLLLAIGAPAASADSIAYIKDGNVWLTTPDGSRQYQVTSSGAYADVSQADDGTMIALSGVRLHRLDREGRVLADFDTPVSDTRPAPAKQFYGPFEPAISPDGTKVAYTYYWLSQSQNSTCFPPACVTTINEGGTGYSHADRQTGWDEPGLGYHSGWRHPAWVDNDTTMLANPTRALNYDVIQDRISDGGNGHGNLVMNWFSDTDDNPHMSGGDITRDRRKLAFQTGANDSTLTVYLVNAFPSGWRDSLPVGSDITRCYRYENPVGGTFGVPTWSPDGLGLAYHDGEGIRVAAVPGFDGGCTLEGATPSPPIVIPGGKEPDWGPADVPAARPAAEAPAPAAGGPAPTLSAKVRRASRRGGITLRVAVPGKGRLTATAKIGKRMVGRASKTVRKAGNASLKVRVRRAGKAVVTVRFKPVAGPTVTTRVATRVR
jgi:hypothetical protein